MARNAQPLVVDLWPGKPPGDPGVDIKDDQRRRAEVWKWTTPPDRDVLGEEYRRSFRSEIPGLGDIQIVTNVTRPTLTVYRPPKERNTGTAILICPGGGYHNLLWELEGEQVAEWFCSAGITGIILKYRVPRRPNDEKFGEPSMPPPKGPLLDAQRAISMVRARSHEWKINPRRIGIVGFSAGGHLAVMSALRFEKRAYDLQDAIDEESCRPDYAIGCYSGYFMDDVKAGLRIPPNTPPVMLAHTTDDSVSNAEHSASMYVALKRGGAPVELHIYSSGNHDFAVRPDLLPSSWTRLCLLWLRNHGLLTPE